tara:strand:+ start:10156 stop:10527 length:372 start_codon:yes stop_codon:yes gene_type:complete
MWELQDQIRNLVDEYFEDSGAARVSAEAVGLDHRAGYVFVSTDEGWIAAVAGNVRSLEYYGGFEYVDDKLSIGEITFYSSDSSRVADAIEYYNDEQQRKEDAEEQQRRDEKNGLYPDRRDDAN